MLRDCLAHILPLWEGIFGQPKLDHLVLCVCHYVERVNQFLKGVGKVSLKWYFIKIQFPRAILSENFSMSEPLRRWAVYVFSFKKCFSRRCFFCKI